MAEPPVADASPLIVLAQGGRLDLLRAAGEPVVVPDTVEREVLRRGAADAAAQAIRSLPWLQVVDPGPVPDVVRTWRLDAGEEAVLTWELAQPGAIAVMDDRRGRRAARALGIPVIGVLGLIVDAKLRGLVPAARTVVEHLLLTTDWRVSPSIVDGLLATIGE